MRDMNELTKALMETINLLGVLIEQAGGTIKVKESEMREWREKAKRTPMAGLMGNCKEGTWTFRIASQEDLDKMPREQLVELLTDMLGVSPEDKEKPLPDSPPTITEGDKEWIRNLRIKP